MITEVKKSAWVAWKEKSAPSETLVGENGSHEAGDHPAQVVLHLEFHHHGTAYQTSLLGHDDRLANGRLGVGVDGASGGGQVAHGLLGLAGHGHSGVAGAQVGHGQAHAGVDAADHVGDGDI